MDAHLAAQRATWSEDDLRRLSDRDLDGDVLLRQALDSEKVVTVGTGSRGEERYALREYLQAELLTPLVAGKTYRFSMHLSLAENSSAATDRIGAHFSTTPISTADYFAMPYVPQLETPAGTFLDDQVEWMTYEELYVATGGEQYVTIGNFHDFADSATVPAGSGPAPPLQDGTGYYYLDAVSLLQLPRKCPKRSL